MQAFREMERLVCVIDCPIMPIYFYVTKNLVKSRVHGFYNYLELPDGSRVANVRDVHPLRGIWVDEVDR
jgi:hypothetical protein